MKTYLLLLLSLTIMITSCSKDDDKDTITPTNDNERLTYKNWTSYKILNSGNDVTASTSSITFDFHTDGTFTATGLGTASGTWSLDNGILFLGTAGSWNVLSISNTDLKIKSNAIEVHLE